MLTPPSENTFSESPNFEICQLASSNPLESTRVEQTKRIYMPRELKTHFHVFVKQDIIKPNLTPACADLYFVDSRSDKSFVF